MPHWIETLGAIWVPLSVATALLVAIDILLLGRRQHMAIMDAVWPLTMLYWGPLGLVFYGWFGRAPRRMQHDHEGHGHGAKPMWQSVFTGASHCGAGCALGDLTGEWLAFATAFKLAGSVMGGKLLLAFVLAYGLGLVFQFFSVAPMRGLGLKDGLVAAAKADTLSLLAYELGMFAVMIAVGALWPNATPENWGYWLAMQVAMVAGFATTYPVNWWLVARGTKEAM